MTNRLAPQALRDYFYLDAFWRVNLSMYIIILLITPNHSGAHVHSKAPYLLKLLIYVLTIAHQNEKDLVHQ